ncbi:LytTR family DNA-binding domain-containing protein [Citromicrobium bathyomarinum]|uniref:LytTR family DNA-binding domain-containing protein n=1 Tax=Sphingomonadales TaxID=204457 RepID=UPI000C3715D8|nr:LytTR family transcriptional regulator [Citromicrobium sp.]|tara:strand:- start:38713 stop:39522 length:810 start_codon:yes stop_codon:yes gene_type:complete
MSDEATTGRHEFARKLLIDLSVMTIVGVILALIGPFGSADAPLAVRLVSWLLFAWVGYAVYNPIGWAVEQLHRSLHLPEIGLWIAGCLIATIPMTAIVWAIGFWPRPVPMPTGEQALEAYINVLIIGASITVLFHLIERSKQAPPAAAAERPAAAARTAPLDAPAPQPAFLERLPGHLGTDLIALEMEDHYVRAHTALGSELVLMRMRDAVAELQGIEGAQVHRSWWVARDAVEDVKREGRNLRLVLPGGIEAPVSRARVTELKQAGWF